MIAGLQGIVSFIDFSFIHNILKNSVDSTQLIVCLGLNETNDYFYPAFFALLDSKTEETYLRLHQMISNITNGAFKPKFFTLDFERSPIIVIFQKDH